MARLLPEAVQSPWPAGLTHWCYDLERVGAGRWPVQVVAGVRKLAVRRRQAEVWDWDYELARPQRKPAQSSEFSAREPVQRSGKSVVECRNPVLVELGAVSMSRLRRPEQHRSRAHEREPMQRDRNGSSERSVPAEVAVVGGIVVPVGAETEAEAGILAAAEQRDAAGAEAALLRSHSTEAVDVAGVLPERVASMDEASVVLGQEHSPRSPVANPCR